MTLENRYDKVMENIEVTQDMRNRILNNINNLDLNTTSKTVIFFHKYKKYFSIAACFVFLFVGSIVLYNIRNISNEPTILDRSAVLDYSTVDELSNSVGFIVKELQDIPFDIKNIQYTSFEGDLAEIQYNGETNTVSFRMAFSDDDVSGDYSEYSLIENHEIDDYTVTIKGNNDKYNLAIWRHAGFSYSINVTNGISETDLLKMVQSIA